MIPNNANIEIEIVEIRRPLKIDLAKTIFNV